MGGERETTMPANTKTKKGLLSGLRIGGDSHEVRIHENESKGEVHFHLDKCKFKVAVPVPRWYAAWDKLRTEPGYWRFYDTKTSCAIEVKTSVRGDLAKHRTGPCSIVAVDITICEAKATPEFADLDKFTNG